MAHNEGLLRRLCSTDETLTEAQTVYRLAQARTGAGSGFELGPFTTGLPAISAYIASKRHVRIYFYSRKKIGRERTYADRVCVWGGGFKI